MKASGRESEEERQKYLDPHEEGEGCGCEEAAVVLVVAVAVAVWCSEARVARPLRCGLRAECEFAILTRHLQR